MSDQENPDGSPRPKRSRLSQKPFQILSLPRIPSQRVSGKTNSQPRPEPELNEEQRKVSARSRTQPVAKNRETNDDFSESFAGVVKKLQLTNFMCHGNFEIEFNPKINFISGVNGSGKSAIQTGIAVGLGGSASKTNRSSKIEGLIKHGCHAGSVTVTLTNTGSNAFKPEEYGQEIKITRSITSSSSKYGIYNQWGKLMSNKKQELDSILCKFKIQPNNPVSILNQDMARNFLSSNKPENKYAMFKKATLLDEAEAMLSNINSLINQQKERIESKERAERQIDKEIAAMTQKMQMVEQLRDAKRRREELKDEFIWAEVHVHRAELKRLEVICEGHEKVKTELQSKADDIQKEIDEKQKKIEELLETLSSLQNESRTKEETIQKYRLDHREKKARYHEKCEEYQRISATIKYKKADKDQIQASLDDIEREENEHKSRKEEAETKMEQLMNECKENESTVELLEQEISRLRNTCAQYHDMKKEKERRVYGLNEEIRANERQMSSLKGSDDLSVYSQWMPTLVRKIDEAVKQRRFSKPPKGPLGRYIKVKNDQWTNAIENNLGGLLSSFFVNNAADRTELYKIMDQVIDGRKPTVHCSQFQERDRNNMLPQIEARNGSYLNMYRALKISDPVVANFLMDMKSIHQILLIEENAVCRQLMSGREWIPNCTAIINKNADSYLEGCRYYANMNPSRARLLQKSVASHINSIKEEIAEKRNAILTEESDLVTLNKQFVEIQNKLENMQKESQKYQQLMFRSNRGISELKNIVDLELPSLQTKFEELNNIEKEIVQLEERKKKVAEEQKLFADEMTKTKKLLDKCGIGDTAFQQTQLSQEIENTKSQMEVSKRRIEGYLKKIEEQNMKLRSLCGRLEEARKKAEEKCTEAAEYSQEPQEAQRRPLQEVKDELNKLMVFIEEAEKTLGTESLNFEKEFLSRQISQRKFKKMFTELKKMHDQYKSMFLERKETIENLRDLCASVIVTQFEKVIQSRNYRGKLVFEHAKGKLDIQLAPPDSGENFMNTESLSGGEKSVSTVAFLMALWSNMDLPFYSMDEYDVFMDAINRRTITKLLIDFAKSKSSQQFLFLTPLDVSVVPTGPEIALHRIRKIM